MAVAADSHKLIPGSNGSHEQVSSQRLLVAMIVSILLHGTVLFGLTFQFSKPNFDRITTSIEVVLVNAKTPTEPAKTELLAQENLDNGGNTDDNRRAKTPFPVLPRNKPIIDDIAAQKKVKQLEKEAKQLMTAVKDKDRKSVV